LVGILLLILSTIAGLLFVLLIIFAVLRIKTTMKIKQIRNKILAIEVDRNVLLQQIKQIEQESL